MKTTPKYTLFAPDFHRGGIKNICFTVVRALSKTTPLDIVTDNTQVFQANVGIENLNYFEIASPKLSWLKPFTLIQTAWWFRTYLQSARPNVVVTFKSPISAALAILLSRHKPKLIIRESNSILALRGNFLVRLVKKHAKMWAYSRATRIIALCEEMHTEIHEKMGVPSAKIRVIYNPTITKRLHDLKDEPVNHPWLKKNANIPVITALGRFQYQKDFLNLIRALAEVVKENRCQLILIGDGIQRKKIVKLADELNVSEHIDLIGFAENPHKYIAKSTIFVLSSRYEGLANALIEAQACGVPTIATACPTSPQEILLGGKAGLLVPVGNHAELARAIKTYLTDAKMRLEHQKVAQAHSGRFDADTNTATYIDLMQEVAK